MVTKRPNSAENTNGGGTAEIHEAEMPVGTQITVKHGRDFARTVTFVPPQCIAGSEGLRQPQVDIFEQFGSGLSVAVEFGQHEAWKGVVNGRCDLGRDDPMSLASTVVLPRWCTARANFPRLSVVPSLSPFGIRPPAPRWSSLSKPAIARARQRNFAELVPPEASPNTHEIVLEPSQCARRCCSAAEN